MRSCHRRRPMRVHAYAREISQRSIAPRPRYSRSLAPDISDPIYTRPPPTTPATHPHYAWHFIHLLQRGAACPRTRPRPTPRFASHRIARGHLAQPNSGSGAKLDAIRRGPSHSSHLSHSFHPSTRVHRLTYCRITYLIDYCNDPVPSCCTPREHDRPPHDSSFPRARFRHAPSRHVPERKEAVGVVGPVGSARDKMRDRRGRLCKRVIAFLFF